MSKNSRIKNSIKNTVYGMSGHLITIVLNFISRTIFIKTLGVEYLGISNLFLSILSVLALAELGVGTAILYKLYKPIAENDRKKINELLHFYSIAYRTIGIALLILGIMLLPFLGFIIGDTSAIHENLVLIYFIFLLNSVLSYFFAFKRSIIIADQKNYIVTTYQYIFNIIQVILQIYVLLQFQNFFLYLVIQAITTISCNYFISRKADKMYPYIKEYKYYKLDKSEIGSIFENIKALAIYKVSHKIVTGTDSIMISILIGLTVVGFYANYQLIIGTLTMFLGILYSSVMASVGNLGATETPEKQEFIFSTLNLVNFFIYGVCSVILISVTEPFIKIWLGEEYLLSNLVLSILILNFFMSGMQSAVATFRDTKGLYVIGKYRPILTIILNIIIPLFLVIYVKMGIEGIFIGTLLARLFTNIWFDPYVIYKHAFKKSVFKYYLKYVRYLIIITVSSAITLWVCNIFFVSASIIELIGRLIISFLIPCILFIVIFHREKEFKYLFTYFCQVFSVKLKKANSNKY